MLDGEILSWKNNKVASFALLQQRIGRKKISPKMLDEIPVILMSYDLLEYNYKDWREKSLSERRIELERVLSQGEIKQTEKFSLITRTSSNKLA